MPDSTATPTDPLPRSTAFRRRLPIGVECIDAQSAHIRLWAPRVSRVDVIVRGKGQTALTRDDDGYFSGRFAASAGDRYQLKLDAGDQLYPDPVSRFQPEGPHGPSEVVDASSFAWSDRGWRGKSREGQVVYEMHLGTFTRAGTWAAAANELSELARLGITLVEVMPVAEFDGRFGWGYDGVDLFAPSHLYGTPDDFRRFVDTAHALGLGVVLDVVYNHFGPSGNYLRAFAPAFFTDRYDNEWGESINFDGPDAGPVREFFVANAAYWIEEFHLDGLRLDATQSIHDYSGAHILAAISQRARAAAAPRSIVIVAENEPQHTRLVRSIADGGYGLDALWNDDFHHSAMVALNGRAEAYYSDTRGEPQEFISAVKYGYLFQGQRYDWQEAPRGTPAWGLPPSAFVVFTQNHDQVANSARGLRGHALTSPGRWRAMTALLLLQPATPMLFQGQEFCASAPFLYFADFDAPLNAAVREGRADFLTQFASIRGDEAKAALSDPGAIETFHRCILDFSERQTHAAAYALHADLLRLRREEPVFSAVPFGGIDGAVLSAAAFVLRFFTPNHSADCLLVVNLGPALIRGSFAEPLLAPPVDRDWMVRWSSESPAYNGGGLPDVFPDGYWHIPAECALFLTAGPQRPRRPIGVLRRTA
jgi:maltooligosyltrehalose trehalohydrolase